MIYLTSQLLFFLLVTTTVGFVMGWLLRGAMLPVSALKGDIAFDAKNESQQERYVVGAATPLVRKTAAQAE